MRFDTKRSFFFAALLVAGVAHAAPAGSGAVQTVAGSDPAPRAVASAGGAHAAPCQPETAKTARPAAAAAKGTVALAAQDSADPELQRIWTGP